MTTTRTSSLLSKDFPLALGPGQEASGEVLGTRLGHDFKVLALNAAADQAFISMSSAFTMLRIRLAFYTCMGRNEMAKEI